MKMYNKFLENYNKEKKYYNEVSVLIAEWAKGGDFLDYIRTNYEAITLI